VGPVYWWALGVILVIVEVFAPGFVFLWLGTSALVAGGLVWLWPTLPWQAQLLSFALLSVASVLGWFAWRRRHPVRSNPLNLNRRAAQQVGAIGNLAEALQNGRGRMHLGDTVWPVEGPDLPAGSRVRVVAVDNGRLRVEPD
jgi:membrane protein implicated in regulation of membrane protease activity